MAQKKKSECKTEKKDYSKNPRKGKRNTRNYSGNSARDEEKVTPRGGINDASWYAYDPQLLADAASISYSWPLGSKLDFDLNSAGLTGIGINYEPVHGGIKEAIPGIIAIGCTACPGISRDNASPINLAARNIYSNVRYTGSGHPNYNSPDLMLYLLAMDSAYSMLSYAQRVYGVSRTYSQSNRYFPRAALIAMGVDPESIHNNLANYRAALNVRATKINAMFVPNAFNYFTRHWWMYSGIYTDGVGAKSQCYMYYPQSYYVYSDTKYTTGGALIHKDWFQPDNHDPYGDHFDTTGHLKTWEDIIKMLDEIIDPLVTSEDMNIMSGDIFKSYGQSGLMRVPTITEDFAVIPEINAEVLLQINNLVAVGNTEYVSVQTDSDTFDRRDIYQQPDGAIIYKPVFWANTPGYLDRWMLNMPMDVPTPADTMVATRLTNIAATVNEFSDQGDFPHALIEYDNMGSEYVNSFSIVSMGEIDGDWEPIFVGYTEPALPGDRVAHPSYLPVSADSVSGTMAVVTALSKFNYHPICVPITWDSDDSAYYRGSALCNTHTIALLTEHDLAKMHMAALLSLFNIPNFVGKK